MRIALDAIGGDHAPAEVVKGAQEACEAYGVEVILVGPEALVRRELTQQGLSSPRVSVVNASQVIAMDEHPALAVRSKPDSSVVVGINLVKRGEAAAFVSAGNSGATVAAALLHLGRIPGIERPALGTVFPTVKGKAMVLDVGATADCKPTHLFQFAYMGSLYMERVMGVEQPKVGLLSLGEEATKGNQLVVEAHALLKRSGLNFIGNVEGNDIPQHKADVVVTDGFTGNVVIKVAEGISESLLSLLREALISRLHFKLAAWVLRPAFRQMAQRLDYSEYGGAPLLGVNGVVIIAHGRSNARAIKNAIGVTKQAIDQGLLQIIAGIESV